MRITTCTLPGLLLVVLSHSVWGAEARPDPGAINEYAQYAQERLADRATRDALEFNLTSDTGTLVEGEPVSISLSLRYPIDLIDELLQVSMKFGLENIELYVLPTVQNPNLPVVAFDPKPLGNDGVDWRTQTQFRVSGEQQVDLVLALQVRVGELVVPDPNGKAGSLVLFGEARSFTVEAQVAPRWYDPIWAWVRANQVLAIFMVAVGFIFVLTSSRGWIRAFIEPAHGTDEGADGNEPRLKGATGSTRQATQTEHYSVAEIGVSDAALVDPDDDLIGTNRLAKGLSLFLSHNKTLPPMTLAISGPWGSGKSSIMGMLKTYMSRARYRPVWFNVWHHQDEEHFFGALLENIRKDGIPPLWHFSGILFRARLMWNRLKQRPLLFTLLGLLALLVVFPDQLLALVSLDELKTESQAVAGLIAGVALLDQFTAFGFSSKDLFKGLASSFKTINFEADAGLRYRVRRCLQDIHCALGDRPMLIFIDDLDRCPPHHVLKVLEIVNFLSSPPLKFLIVFGISLDKVIPVISPSFTQQVEEEFPIDPGQGQELRNHITRTERLKLARHYMRKMINIEVSVPVASVQELIELARQNPNQPPRLDTSQDEANRRAKMLDQKVFPVSVAVLLAGFLFMGPFGGLERVQTLDLFSGVGTEQNADSVAGARTEADPGTANRSGEVTQGTENLPAVTGNNDTHAGTIVEPYRLTIDSLMPFVIAALVVLGVLGAFLRRETRLAQIGDSDTFLSALDIWAPVLNALDPTPRHYIRMVNQLRLLSMRMRLERNESEEPAAHSDSDGEQSDEPGSQTLSSEDRKMVYTTILSALHELGVDATRFMELVPLLATKPEGLGPVVAKLKPPHLTPVELERARAALMTSIALHVKKFPDVWPSENDIDEFQGFMRGVQLS